MSSRGLRIVTDSSADIPVEMAHNLGITVIPCQIHLDGQTYRDSVDIGHQEFYDRLRNVSTLTTSQPAVGDFAEAYRQALRNADQVIAVHLGSGFSGLFDTARLAAREVDSSRIALIDSRQVSMCLGWAVLHAAEEAKRGCQASEVISQVLALLPRLRLYALIDDLHFLHRGGRVGWVSGMVGSLFAIKPIIRVQDGRADLVEKVRSFRRGIERLAALAEEAGPLERLAVLHAGAAESARLLADRISPFFRREQVLIAEAGAVISAHAGPGAVGLACLLAC